MRVWALLGFIVNPFNLAHFKFQILSPLKWTAIEAHSTYSAFSLLLPAGFSVVFLASAESKGQPRIWGDLNANLLVYVCGFLLFWIHLLNLQPSGNPKLCPLALRLNPITLQLSAWSLIFSLNTLDWVMLMKKYM